MSVLDIPFDAGLMVFIGLATVAVVSSLLVVRHKSIVYSAFFLGILGMANAALFTLLGFAFIAVFYIAVYIGAAVTFILFSVTMYEEAPPVERPIRIVTVISVLLTAFLLIGTFGLYFTGSIQPSYVNYRDLASLLAEKYWFALIIAALTLVTTLIEAITLARIEEARP